MVAQDCDLNKKESMVLMVKLSMVVCPWEAEAERFQQEPSLFTYLFLSF